MTARICAVESCEKDARKRGRLCPMHNSRMMRHRDLDHVVPGTRGNVRLAAASYPSAHRAVERARGKARDYCCAGHCGGRAAHWAYDAQYDDAERVVDGRGRVYSRDIERYFPLCAREHAAYDRAVRRWREEQP